MVMSKKTRGRVVVVVLAISENVVEDVNKAKMRGRIILLYSL